MLRRDNEWSDEETTILKANWLDRSASEIAKMLPGELRTRCAVIGRAKRLGLADKGTQKGTYQRCPKQPRERHSKRGTTLGHAGTVPGSYDAPHAAERFLAPLPSNYPEKPTVLTIMDRQCRWPIGNPGDPDFHFCGKRQFKRLSYCLEHLKVGLVPWHYNELILR